MKHSPEPAMCFEEDASVTARNIWLGDGCVENSDQQPGFKSCFEALERDEGSCDGQ